MISNIFTKITLNDKVPQCSGCVFQKEKKCIQCVFCKCGSQYTGKREKNAEIVN